MLLVLCVVCQFVTTQVFVSRHPSFPEYAGSLFATLDRDGDGLLSAVDLSNGLAQLCPDQPAAFVRNLRPECNPFLSTAGSRIRVHCRPGSCCLLLRLVPV